MSVIQSRNEPPGLHSQGGVLVGYHLACWTLAGCDIFGLDGIQVLATPLGTYWRALRVKKGETRSHSREIENNVWRLTIPNCQ